MQVSRRRLNCEKVEGPKQASPLSGSCEGDDGVQIFLPFTCWLWSTHGRQFDVRERHNACSAAALLPHRAPCRFVLSTTPGNPRRLDTFRSSRMNGNARAPWDEGCSRVSPTVSRALRSTTHKSCHGFADGSPCSQGANSFPALIVRMLAFPTKRTRVLLTCPVSHI